MPKTKKSLIKTKDEPVLREVAKHVPVDEIKSKEVQSLLTTMAKALHGEDDGVAIAAPQVGVSSRIFIVNTQALFEVEEGNNNEADKKGVKANLVFINPEIKKLSRKKVWMEEGCLSVRWLYGKVERSEKATVVAYDENGKKFEKGASGLLAQIFQHEIDHLDGILFIDKAKDLEDLPPHEHTKL
ncbi:MAG: peptide deformylase [Parcubacteria group bacterium]